MLFSFIPAAILVGAGYSAASQTSDLPVSPLTRGAAVTVGYLAVLVLAIVYAMVRVGTLSGSFGGSGAAGGAGGDVVGLAIAVVFTGLAFPLVFGALGGWIAQARGY